MSGTDYKIDHLVDRERYGGQTAYESWQEVEEKTTFEDTLLKKEENEMGDLTNEYAGGEKKDTNGQTTTTGTGTEALPATKFNGSVGGEKMRPGRPN